MRSLTRSESNILTGIPIIALLALNALFYLIFPIYEKLGGWVLKDLGSMPFLVWVPVGALLGFLMNMGMKKKRELMVTYTRRMIVGLIGWFFLSVMVSLITGSGDLFSRLDNGPLFKAWSVLIFVLASMSPNVFAVYSIFSRKRWSMAGTMISFFLLALICMVFSQGRYALALDQDPLLSLLFIWAAVLYIESISWKKRYLDRDISEFPEVMLGKALAGPLMKRQLLSTLMVIGVASILAFSPVLLVTYFRDGIMDVLMVYEIGTVYGTAIIGFVLIMPLTVLALLRRWLDGRSAGPAINGEVEAENQDATLSSFKY
ncbi:MAG: hypothetical protein JXA22_09210 [Candidatus Thermoplasmatota archaeon]|nr:hypothetical protein [Candidatus Thermoplasmatota archaeon]